MPRKEFVEEHVALLPILRKGSKKQQVKEADEQEQELRELRKKVGKVVKIHARMQQLSIAAEEYFQYYYGLTPIPTEHPPSLKNPQQVKIPSVKDYKKDKKARDRDLAIQIEKALRQIGRPTISQTAQMPLYPNISQWM